MYCLQDNREYHFPFLIVATFKLNTSPTACIKTARSLKTEYFSTEVTHLRSSMLLIVLLAVIFFIFDPISYMAS